MIKRKDTRQISVGPVRVGGDAPVSVQSMTNTKTADTKATSAQIKSLTEAGCDIVRIAVLDDEDARSIGAIIEASAIPVIADIHFNHRFALEAVRQGVHGLRLNPGNIGDRAKVKKVV
ncbi:MAG: flavodoxin-dependent (E)-4-hydroxy-3-methylbut-2-enyl-diphosphate synthase, partial [Desulfobacteraceae bacterium]|nr:flavodoxin-dependent (E)-4-hydroxy-3-methylbut-2-enyl-diphosphate synthase [Desulfobacteraceae bacterium]